VSREENNCYGAIAGFLEEIGVAVPRIMAHDATRGFIVMEDMGNMDLWSLRHQPWRVKQGHYRKVLNVIYRLHAFPLRNFPADQIPLMKGFGPEIYRWEHEYFLGDFVRAFCGIKMSGPESEALWEELGDLTKRLEHTVLCLVHRDFQSRNIMIRDGEPVLIDFQGMRSGNLLYDLGSLLYDPYVFFTEDERMDLLMHYFQRQNILPSSWSAFKEMFYDAASQRLMQALGAYGFLGITRGLKDFLTHIPNGLTNLIDASARTKHMPCLSALARKCNDRCDPCLSVDTTTA